MQKTEATSQLSEVGDLTSLLDRWSEGDRSALGQVVSFLYRELHRLATVAFHRERPEHTLQPTAVLHELYLNLIEQTGIRFQNREHFVGLAAHMMRRILVDHARRRGRLKRGGGALRISLEQLEHLSPQRPADLLALEEALESLAILDARKVRLVELRFFGGLSFEEAASCLGISRATAVREWQRTRAWLYGELIAEPKAMTRRAGS